MAEGGVSGLIGGRHQPLPFRCRPQALLIPPSRCSSPKMNTGDSLSAFSALNFFTNYNQLMGPTGNNLVQVYHHYCGSPVGEFSSEEHSGNFPFPSAIGGFQPYLHYPISSSSALPDFKTRSLLTAYGRRSRGEKKPIPDDQKDDRYYERRKRNNQAAKKSRDARKLREDQIALRATLLEHENAILRAQVLTLREETQSLRQIILSQKKNSGKPLTGFTKKECNLEGDWKNDFHISTKELSHTLE